MNIRLFSIALAIGAALTFLFIRGILTHLWPTGGIWPTMVALLGAGGMGGIVPSMRKRFLQLPPVQGRVEQAHRQRLSELSRSLALVVDLDQLLDEEIGKTKELLDAERAAILLADIEGERLALRANRGYDDAVLRSVCFERDDRLLKWLDTNETHLMVKDNPGVLEFLEPWERNLLERLGVDLVLPLIAMNRLVGMLFLTARGEGFSGADLELLTAFSHQGGLAFENALLYEQRRLRLRRMYRAERLAITGQLAAGAAHEIRNPLTSIRSTIQYLRRDYQDDPEELELIDELLGEADRINAIIEGLLSFARPAEPKLEELVLPELIDQAVLLVRTTARKAGVEIHADLTGVDGTIQGDPTQLKQVFLNVMLNAIQAMPEGGALSISLSSVSETGALGRGERKFQVDFVDTGVGISEEDLDRIFDPFYTTKEEGTGLGLAICYGIVQRHGGEIDVESRVGEGTRVRIRL